MTVIFFFNLRNTSTLTLKLLGYLVSLKSGLEVFQQQSRNKQSQRRSPDANNEHERRYWVQHFVDFVGLVKLTHYASRSNCCFPKGKGHIKEE